MAQDPGDKSGGSSLFLLSREEGFPRSPQPTFLSVSLAGIGSHALSKPVTAGNAAEALKDQDLSLHQLRAEVDVQHSQGSASQEKNDHWGDAPRVCSTVCSHSQLIC